MKSKFELAFKNQEELSKLFLSMIKEGKVEAEIHSKFLIANENHKLLYDEIENDLLSQVKQTSISINGCIFYTSGDFLINKTKSSIEYLKEFILIHKFLYEFKQE